MLRDKIIKKLLYILIFIIPIAVIAIIFLDTSSSLENKGGNKQHKFKRIISLSPSITETLFALNLGENIVGRTRFCNYPKATEKIMEVGGYLDPNYEAIISLQPDVVILLPEQEKVKKYLDQLNIPSFEVNNKTINDIITSIKIIGDSCSVKSEANKLLLTISSKIASIKEKVKGSSKPKTLISIGRTAGSKTLKGVYVAGTNTYFSELINIAGGINALDNSNKIAYPMLSAEGLIHLNPEVIIDLIPNLKTNNLTKQNIINEWKTLGNIDAIKNNRIKVLSNNYVVVPGPRFIFLLQDLAMAIHPEVDWNE
jgi:iron complex transport system substrate-binding protein